MNQSKQENPNEVNAEAPKSQGCCGGPPVANKDACCVKDEKAKAAGAEGCGCAAAAPAPVPAPAAAKGCCP